MFERVQESSMIDTDTGVQDPSLPQAIVYEININDIAPNQEQPRKRFDHEALQELAESIRLHGVIQPVIVTKQGSHYRLVAGERRWRAARIARLPTIPAIVRELSDREVMQQALIENIQREDLNPIEESKAYERLLHDYNLTQIQLAEVVGKSRSTIANSLRLNQLNQGVQGMLVDGMITAGHARAILSLEDRELQTEFAEHIIADNLSVRNAEKKSKTFAEDLERKRKAIEQAKRDEKERSQQFGNVVSAEESQRIALEEKLTRHLGHPVHLMMNEGKGRVVIEYKSLDEFDELLDNLGLAEDH